MPINKYLLKKEKAFTNTVFRYFNKSRNEIKDYLIKQDTQKSFTTWLNELLDKINVWLAIIIWWKSKEVVNRGVSSQGRLFNEVNFSIDWNLKNEPAVKYIDEIVALHSSNIKNWSIWATTHTRVKKLISKWLKENLTYTQIGKQINDLDWLVFSKWRAESIAISELWNAYEYWKYRQMQEFEKDWDVVVKEWITAEDERVRPEHKKNWDDWFIWFNERFSWTDSLIAPSWIRCRCSIGYDIL